MLNKEYLSGVLLRNVDGFKRPETQVLEANGLDAILELLSNLRAVEFPVAVLEGRSSGTVQLVEGPVDTFTESVWIMGQLGRDESEVDLYEQTRRISLQLLAGLLADASNGAPELSGWDWSRTHYMKRHGGQNARGWELVLTFKENFSLLVND